VLLKMSNNDKASPSLKPEVKLVISDSQPSYETGSSIELNAHLVDNGSEIKKINFYNGLNLIGSSNKSPYKVAWKNLPVGKHHLWASAIDAQGNEINSQEIDIEVKAKKIVL